MSLNEDDTDEHQCRKCEVWSAGLKWVAFDQACDVCGEHEAYLCPACGHVHEDPSNGLDSLPTRRPTP